MSNYGRATWSSDETLQQLEQLRRENGKLKQLNQRTQRELDILENGLHRLATNAHNVGKRRAD